MAVGKFRLYIHHHCRKNSCGTPVEEGLIMTRLVHKNQNEHTVSVLYTALVVIIYRYEAGMEYPRVKESKLSEMTNPLFSPDSPG